jgi:hypothetical protein
MARDRLPVVMQDENSSGEELLRGQLDRLTGAPDALRVQIDLEVRTFKVSVTQRPRGAAPALLRASSSPKAKGLVR